LTLLLLYRITLILPMNLNIFMFNGCTKGYQNSKKPKDPDKHDIIEYQAPKPVLLPRPSANFPFINVKPSISSTYLQQRTATSINNSNRNYTNSLTDISIGTMCKTMEANRSFQFMFYLKKCLNIVLINKIKIS